MSHGGPHLVPLLERHGDVFVCCSRLGKVDKADLLHRAVTTVSATFSTSTRAVGAHGPPGTPYVETVLGHSAVLKVRSYEPPQRTAPTGPSVAPGVAPPVGMTEEEAVLAPIDTKPNTAAAAQAASTQRRASELIWRMPHCYVRSIDALEQPPPPAVEAPTAADGIDDEGPPPCFVVTFFSTKSKKKASPKATIKRLVAAVPAAATPSPYELRAREYECASTATRDEWLILYRSAVRNYWHQRLEATVMAAPEVYQFHTWALDAGKGHRLVQLALSSVALYAVARSAPEQLENDIGISLTAANGTVARSVVMEVKLVRIQRAKAIVDVASKSLNGSFQFFSTAEAVRFVAELQRVWDTVHHYSPGQASDQAAPPLPFEVA